MVSPIQQRAAADYLRQEYGVSQRRICRVMGRSRSTLRYVRRPRGDEGPLGREIKCLRGVIRDSATGGSTPC